MTGVGWWFIYPLPFSSPPHKPVSRNIKPPPDPFQKYKARPDEKAAANLKTSSFPFPSFNLPLFLCRPQYTYLPTSSSLPIPVPPPTTTTYQIPSRLKQVICLYLNNNNNNNNLELHSVAHQIFARNNNPKLQQRSYHLITSTAGYSFHEPAYR